MPLSRHFYSLDEVQAALLYTTTRNSSTESLFWCQEMLLSGCVSETISTLFQSWLWNTGSMRLQWLINAWNTLASNELNEDDILLSTYHLSSIPSVQRDNSLWNILVLTAQNPDKIPDTITRKTPPILPSQLKEEIYFVCAMYQGKARAAWWISRHLETSRVWELLNWFIENIHVKFSEQYKTCLNALQNYDQLLGYKSAEYDVIILCTAVIMMCIREEKQTESLKKFATEIDKYNSQLLNEWATSIGRKDRRIYQIPSACLYGTTLRGRNKWSENNFIQLNNIEKYLVGCSFWDEVLAEYANVTEENEIRWHSDLKMDEFYEKYFPDDIPDEWSKKDKIKSHGDGILSPTEKPNISKYSRNYLSKYPRLAWNTTKDTNNFLETLDIRDCSLERIIQFYKSPTPFSEEDLKKLEPVHKIKCR